MNKYQRTVPATTIDVYDVLVAFDVRCPARQHAIKKLLAAGERGHKGVVDDLREAAASIQRAIELAERKEVMPDVSFDWLQLRVLPSEVPAHVARRSGVDSDTRSVQ